MTPTPASMESDSPYKSLLQTMEMKQPQQVVHIPVNENTKDTAIHCTSSVGCRYIACTAREAQRHALYHHSGSPRPPAPTLCAVAAPVLEAYSVGDAAPIIRAKRRGRKRTAAEADLPDAAPVAQSDAEDDTPRDEDGYPVYDEAKFAIFRADAPPPPAHAEASSSAASPAPRTTPRVGVLVRGEYKVLPVPGGFLHFSAKLGKVNAHCDRRKHNHGCTKCKMDRSFEHQKHSHRPLGLLMAWLEADAATKPAHSECKKRVLGPGAHGVRLAARKRFLQYVGTLSGDARDLAGEILARERPENHKLDREGEPLNPS